MLRPEEYEFLNIFVLSVSEREGYAQALEMDIKSYILQITDLVTVFKVAYL